MTPEERFAWIKLRVARFPRTREMSRTGRGCAIGRVTRAVKSAADLINLPVSNARDRRLKLAAAIFGCPVESYNELRSNELWALDQWVRLGNEAVSELKVWLQSQYGAQPQLL